MLATATGRRPEAVGTRGTTRRSLSAKRGGLLVVQGLYRTRRLDRGGCVVWRVIARRTEVRQPAVHRSDSGRVLHMTGRRNEPRQRVRRFDVRLRLATGVFGPHVILAAVLQAHRLLPRLLGSRRMLGPGVLLARLFLARLFLTRGPVLLAAVPITRKTVLAILAHHAVAATGLAPALTTIAVIALTFAAIPALTIGARLSVVAGAIAVALLTVGLLGVVLGITPAVARVLGA